MDTPQFCETPAPYGQARIAVLPAPYEGTVSYGTGAAKGPQAIIAAGPNAEMYDLPTGDDYAAMKIATLPAPDLSGTPDEVMPKVERAVAAILKDGKKPLMLGGEHSITGPAVRAAVQHYGSGSIGVVQVDAHADLRQEFTGTPHSHASVMARVREVAPALQLGIRSCSREEADWIRRDNLPVLSPAGTLEGNNMVKELLKLPDNIYLTFDIDGLDPSVMPATGTPEPGGFNWSQATWIIQTVARYKTVVGADLVELAPIDGFHAYDYTAARLAYALAAALYKNGKEEG